MPKLKINHLDFYYDTVGGGQSLVFISGVSSDHAGWLGTQVPDFKAAGYRCLVFDNRDAGQTGESPIPAYGVRQFADDTAALIRQLDFGPTHIIGASMGGMIAQEIALNHPDCVRSLTLVCTTAKADLYMINAIEAWKTAAAKLTREEFLQSRMPWLFTHRFYQSVEAMEAYRRRVLSNPHPQSVPSFHRQCDALIAHDTLDRLASIQFPTHVVVGAEDILIPSRHSQIVAERIPGARLTVLPDTAHCLFWETPTAFNRAVLNFLQ